jgi:hypothetical protein
MKTSLDDLCENIPSCFKEYIKHCKNLKFDESPNYEYLKSLFYGLANNDNLELKYSWEKND